MVSRTHGFTRPGAHPPRIVAPSAALLNRRHPHRADPGTDDDSTLRLCPGVLFPASPIHSAISAFRRVRTAPRPPAGIGARTMLAHHFGAEPVRTRSLFTHGFARLDSRTRPVWLGPSELGDAGRRVLPARRPESDTSPRNRCPAPFDLRHEEATDQQCLNNVAKRRRGVSATSLRQTLGRLSGHTLLDGQRRSRDQRPLAIVRRCATVTTKTHCCMPRPTPVTGKAHSLRTRMRNTASTIAHVRSIAGTTVLIEPRRNDAAVPVVPIDVLQIRSFLVCA